MSDTFRAIDKKPIFWRSKNGEIHSVEGADVHRGVRLLWTLCERDVPADTAYQMPGENVTCTKCLAVHP